MKTHKTSTFRQYLDEENPLTVCGIKTSFTGAGNFYHRHMRWAKVTCKKCLKLRKKR